jgi:hypothetical protein
MAKHRQSTLHSGRQRVPRAHGRGLATVNDPTTKQPHSACAFGASCRFFHLVKGVHTKQDFEAGVQTISTGKKPVLSGAILKKVNAAVAKL